MSVLGSTIIDVTNHLGIPNGRIQNGAANYLLAGYSRVQTLFFWDNLSQSAYNNSGYKGKGIITGNLKIYERIQNGFNKSVQNLFTKSFKDKILVLVAFSGPGHNISTKGHIKTLELLVEIINLTPEIVYLIKLHPKDKIDYYASFLHLKNIVFTDLIPWRDDKPDALDILFQCQALITGGSSVALDAMQLGKIVISIDPLGELEHFKFLNTDKVHRINNIGECNKINNLLESNKQNNPDTHLQTIFKTNPIELIANHILDKQCLK